MEDKDKQLLKMIRKHPEEGMGLLIDEYGGAIKTICSNVLRNYDADIVQDVMQETVIRLWQKLSQRFQVKKNLKAYIYQTARNCALDHLKEDNGESRIRRGKKHRKKTKYMKAAAVAACVLIVAPTTIYGKEIQKFFQSKWKQNIFRMEVQVTKEKKSKQNVSLDTSNLKQYEVTKEKFKNETWYTFKNQKANQKDFYARMIKVD